MDKVAFLQDHEELCLVDLGRSDSWFNPRSSWEESSAELKSVQAATTVLSVRRIIGGEVTRLTLMEKPMENLSQTEFYFSYFSHYSVWPICSVLLDGVFNLLCSIPFVLIKSCNRIFLMCIPLGWSFTGSCRLGDTRKWVRSGCTLPRHLCIYTMSLKLHKWSVAQAAALSEHDDA